jgi:AbrB family looped-hinge helix DNA binding protein
MARYKISKERGVRAREAMPEYDGSPALASIPVYHVAVADRGRLVLPLEIRQKLNIRDGDRVSLTLEDDGSVVLQTVDVAIRRLRGMFKHLAKPGKLASDELIAERRREARREDRKFKEWDARLRKAGK